MKSIEDIRRENLLFESKRLGGDAALARKLGKDKNQVYQWLKAAGDKQRRNMTGTTARKAEAALDRPRGWLDTDHSGDAATAPAQLSEGMAESRPKNNVRALRIAMQSFGTILRERMPTVAEDVAADIVEVAGTEFASHGFLGTLVGILKGAQQTSEASPHAAPQAQASSASRRARAR